MKLVRLLPLLLLGAASPAAAQISLTGAPYTQDFDTLANSGTSSTVPAGWAFAEAGTNANALYTAGTGSGNSGDTYSFGAAAATDRAFGGLQSGSLTPTVGAQFQNDTGAALTALTVAYTGEQWRLGTAGRVDRLDFQYSTDATSLTTGTWIDVDSLDFTAPVTTAPTGALDGNLAANRTAISFTIGSLAIANGGTFWVRWGDFNASGADDGLSIDDVTISTGGAPTVNLTVDNVALAEGNSGTSTFTFTVSLSAPAGAGGVTFDVATADNTATLADNDYQQVSLTGQTILPGASSKTVDVLVNGDTTTEPNETFFLNVTNVTGATVLDGQGQGTINNDDVTLTPIHSIQGTGNSSPLAGQTVTTRGIVTGLKSNGFFVQEPDATIDADPNTSEGIFVFTSSAPPAAAALGNLVQVTATISEFSPPSDLLQPPLTELTTPTVVQLSTGNPLPAAIAITAADTPAGGTIHQLERLEGMRVSIASLLVVAPTSGSVNEPNATATTNGVLYGVIPPLTRPFREAGIQADDPPPAGSGVTIPPVPRFDSNPERIRVDTDGQTGGVAIDAGAGAMLTGLVGVLDYGFRTYSVLPDPATPPTLVGGPVPTAVAAPTNLQFTVATYNMERFYDTADDAGTSDVVLTTTAFNNRLNKASLAIRDFLRFPDILAVVEMENLSTLQTLAAKVNADAIANSQPDPGYTAFLEEGNDVGGIDVGFLVKSAVVVGATPRVSVVSVTQEGKTTTWIDPSDNTSQLLNDRPPLRLNAVVNHPNGSSFAITVIAVHQRSLNGIADETVSGLVTVGDRVRQKRRAQSEYLANLIQARQVATPSESIMVVGDFNAFEVNDGYVDNIGTIVGKPTAAGSAVLTSSDLVNPDLVVLAESSPDERYSYSFDGNAQTLDHVIVNAMLNTSATITLDHARINADFPATARNNASSAARLSDHDPVVAFLSIAAFPVELQSFEVR